MLLAVLYSVTTPGLKLRALELHELELLEPEPEHKLVLVPVLALVRLSDVGVSVENVAREDLGSCFGSE